MKHYIDYLPNYLDGPNIQTHAAIMDMADYEVNELLNLVGLWSTLQRPILIQREAVSLDNIHMIVHIHIPQLIKKITITGEYQYTREYDEADIIDETQIEFYIRGSNDTLKMPHITVTVETHDEITYSKSYPENDTPQDNTADHDTFLDRIGNLLGIPRRQYNKYNFTDAENSTPPYMGKTIQEETINNETVQMVQSCTEDDYYYKERIQYYLDNFNKMPLPILLLRTIYGYEHVTEINAAQIRENNEGMWDHLEQLEGYSSSIEDAGTYVFLVNRVNPVNIDSLSTEDKVAFVDRYIPLTREAFILPQLLTTLTIIDFPFYKSVNQYFYAELRDEYGRRVMGRDLTWQVDDLSPMTTRQTNENSVAYAMFEHVPMGYHLLTAGFPTGNGYEGSNNQRFYKSYLDMFEVQDAEVPATFIYPFFEVYKMEYAKRYMYVLDVEGDDYIVYLRVVFGSSSFPWLRTVTPISGRHIVTILPAEMSVLVDGVAVEVEDHADSFNPQLTDENHVRVHVKGETSGYTVYNTWVTDYKPYNNENVVLDEFTLRYHVYIPEDYEDDEYSVTLGQSQGQNTYGYTINIPVDLLGTGMHILEYKFIDFHCFAYIDDVYQGSYYDFEDDTLHDYDLDTGSDTVVSQASRYMYTHNPRMIGVEHKESYLLPLTDLPMTVSHVGELDVTLEFYITENTAYQTVLDHREAQYLSVMKLYDHHGNPASGKVTLTQTVNGGTPTTSTKNITNGEWYRWGQGLDEAGVIQWTAEYQGGWKRNASAPVTVELQIHANPMTLTLDVRSANDDYTYYSSDTAVYTVKCYMEAEHLNSFIAENPARYPEGVTLTLTLDGNEYTTTTDVNGYAEFELPVGEASNTTQTFNVSFEGNTTYAAVDTTETIMIEKNRHVLTIDAPTADVSSHSTATVEVNVSDLYGEPVTRTTVYAVNTFRNIKLTSRPDENGDVTFNVPTNEAGTINLRIYTTSNSYSSYAIQTIQIHSVDINA